MQGLGSSQLASHLVNEINQGPKHVKHLGSTWYHSDPLKVPYSLKQFLSCDFFCCLLQQTGSSSYQLPLGRIKVMILIILDIWQVSLNSGWFCITILILNRFLPYLVGSPEPASLLSVEHVSAKSTIDRLSGIHNMVFHI